MRANAALSRVRPGSLHKSASPIGPARFGTTTAVRDVAIGRIVRIIRSARTTVGSVTTPTSPRNLIGRRSACHATSRAKLNRVASNPVR